MTNQMMSNKIRKSPIQRILTVRNLIRKMLSAVLKTVSQIPHPRLKKKDSPERRKDQNEERRKSSRKVHQQLLNRQEQRRAIQWVAAAKLKRTPWWKTPATSSKKLRWSNLNKPCWQRAIRKNRCSLLSWRHCNNLKTNVIQNYNKMPEVKKRKVRPRNKSSTGRWAPWMHLRILFTTILKKILKNPHKKIKNKVTVKLKK